MIKTKDYEFSAKNDSKVKVEIKTEIENLNKDDLQEILSEFAIRTRDFYLGLGNEINKDNKVKKVIKVKKFVVCPHCKRPLYRKKDSKKELNFCGYCGIELPNEYRTMPKKRKRKGIKVKKFVICPHCQRALFKKKILKNPKMGMTMCYHCGISLPDAFHKTSGKTKKH